MKSLNFSPSWFGNFNQEIEADPRMAWTEWRGENFLILLDHFSMVWQKIFDLAQCIDTIWRPCQTWFPYWCYFGRWKIFKFPVWISLMDHLYGCHWNEKSINFKWNLLYALILLIWMWFRYRQIIIIWISVLTASTTLCVQARKDMTSPLYA